MELYEALPSRFQSSLNNEIPIIVAQTLNYQWKTCHELAAHSPQLSHSLSNSFCKLVREYGIILPDYAQKRLCAKCCAIQLPSLTSKMSIISKKWLPRSEKRKFQIARKSATSENIYSKYLVLKCIVCKQKDYLPGIKVTPAQEGSSVEQSRIGATAAAARSTGKGKNPDTASSYAVAPSAPKVFSSSSSSHVQLQHTVAKKKFSFLDRNLSVSTVSSRGASPSSIRPSSTPSSTSKVSGHRGGTITVGSLAQIFRSNNGVLFGAKGGLDGVLPSSSSSPAGTTVPGNNKINLDEIQRAKKKQKRTELKQDQQWSNSF